MTTRPVTVPPSMTVRDASKVMRDHQIGSLLVVNEDGNLVGIMLADDIIHRVTAEAIKSDVTSVESVMTKEVIDILPEADIYQAMVLMRDNDIMHLPVRDENKRLVGYLTLKDILKIEPEMFELLAELWDINNGPGALRHRERREGYCEQCGNYAADLTKKEGKNICHFCAEP